MLETGLIVGHHDEPLYWHVPNDRTVVSLPDSETLWGKLWAHFKYGSLKGFAHSHPGSGIPSPSHTDVTTFAAIESGLGTTLDWWITSRDHVVLLRRVPPGSHNTPGFQHAYFSTVIEAPPWTEKLRRLSEPNEEI